MGNDNNSSRFLYSVNPKKAIKNLAGIPLLRSSRSLNLTKEEVLYCMKYGYVYRRFANEGRVERVNIDNLDRLHNEKFMTEEEYKTFVDESQYAKRGSVIVDNNENKSTPPKEEKVEESTPVVEPEPEHTEPVVEKVQDETPVEEEVVEEVLSGGDDGEPVVTEYDPMEIFGDTDTLANTNNNKTYNNNYNGKKKKRK